MFRKLSSLLMLMVSTAAVASTSINNATTNVATYNETKQNILVSSSQPEFIIKLKSNPTTGYSWFLREYDADLITPVKHVVEAANSNLMGAPGFEVWTFKVKPAGFTVPQQTVIRFIYARPWQGTDSATQMTFRVTTRSGGYQ